MTGIDVVLELLAGVGVRHIFGNPGTTELPLNDALARDARFRYVLGLHEIAVTAMADGFALASGTLGVVNVHIGCGLGNAMGMLYNAHCEGTPLLLFAGQQDRRLRMEDPVLATDLVGVARPWTKWAYEVQSVRDLPTVVRRAVQTALTPPTGPVFLAIPVDVQLETHDDAALTPPRVPARGVRPPLAALRRAAELLSGAANPVILAGSRVAEADAVGELVAVAECLGAPVYSESGTSHGRLPIPPGHELYAGCLPVWSPEVRQRLGGFDVALVVGMSLFRSYIYHPPGRAIPDSLRLVQLDEDPWQLGKTYPVEVGLVGDPKAGLAELQGLLREMQTASQREAAASRRLRQAEQTRTARADLLRRLDAEKDRRPLTPLAALGALARVLPPQAAVIEEAVTTTDTVLERLAAFQDPRAYFGHRGWALGWGIGCAVGVKLAWPDRPVLALIGDGAALYGLQGLWSAAHEQLPVTFIICNNRQYRILKHCGAVMPLPQMGAGKYVGMDLVRPEVDFVGLARALGVAAARVDSADELGERAAASLRGDQPTVLEVLLAC